MTAIWPEVMLPENCCHPHRSVSFSCVRSTLNSFCTARVYRENTKVYIEDKTQFSETDLLNRTIITVIVVVFVVKRLWKGRQMTGAVTRYLKGKQAQSQSV